MTELDLLGEAVKAPFGSKVKRNSMARLGGNSPRPQLAISDNLTVLNLIGRGTWLQQPEAAVNLFRKSCPSVLPWDEQYAVQLVSPKSKT